MILDIWGCRMPKWWRLGFKSKEKHPFGLVWLDFRNGLVDSPFLNQAFKEAGADFQRNNGVCQSCKMKDPSCLFY